MLVFVEGGKVENQEKTPQSKVRINNKLNPHKIMSLGKNLTQPAMPSLLPVTEELQEPILM